MNDPHVMKKRTGGGLIMLFGMPFLLAGLAVMAAPFGLLPSEAAPPPWYLMVPFGSIFATVGAAFVFGRAGVTVDKLQGRIITWWGLLVPFKSTQYNIADYDRVAIRQEVRRSKNSTYTIYPVRIEGGVESIDWDTLRDPTKARAAAEELAKFLGFKVVDASAGEEIVREADRLDESLRERRQRTGEDIDMPDPPANMRTQCQVDGESITLIIPPPPATIFDKISLAFAFVPGIVALGFFFAAFPKDMPPLFRFIFMGFIGVFFVIAPITVMVGKVLARTRTQQKINASPDRLRVETRGPFRTKVVEIPANELEELQIALPKGHENMESQLEAMPEALRPFLRAMARRVPIRAISDRATVTFGKGLPIEELKWVHAVLTQVLTA